MDKVNFLPKYQISQDTFLKINKMAGMVFNNNSLNLDFERCRSNSPIDDDLIEVNLTHIGIDVRGFITKTELNRLLRIETKYLDEEYLSYLISKKSVEYGINFVKFLEKKDKDLQPLYLFKSQLSYHDIQMIIYLDINSIEIDNDYMEVKYKVFSENVRLNTELDAFETKLTTEEINMLSSNDLILVYPK